LPAILVIVFLDCFQIFSGVGSTSAMSEGGVGYMAHIGGFFSGLLLTTLFKILGHGR
jgi:membrane associated rhomboid family serine protease